MLLHAPCVMSFYCEALSNLLTVRGDITSHDVSTVHFLRKGRCAMPHTQALTAFCATCPDPQEVTTILRGLGFSLTFQMEAILYPASSEAPDLPAQFHFQGHAGVEVIYLQDRIRQRMGSGSPRTSPAGGCIQELMPMPLGRSLICLPHDGSLPGSVLKGRPRTDSHGWRSCVTHLGAWRTHSRVRAGVMIQRWCRARILHSSTSRR